MANALTPPHLLSTSILLIQSTISLGAFAKAFVAVQKDRYNRCHDGPRVMRKLDKSKCRQQLSTGSSGSRQKSASLAQCQQKLKKTSISDKIAAALRRQ